MAILHHRLMAAKDPSQRNEILQKIVQLGQVRRENTLHCCQRMETWSGHKLGGKNHKITGLVAQSIYRTRGLFASQESK